jgi:hypothetical protein
MKQMQMFFISFFRETEFSFAGPDSRHDLHAATRGTPRSILHRQIVFGDVVDLYAGKLPNGRGGNVLPCVGTHDTRVVIKAG